MARKENKWRNKQCKHHRVMGAVVSLPPFCTSLFHYFLLAWLGLELTTLIGCSQVYFAAPQIYICYLYHSIRKQTKMEDYHTPCPRPHCTVRLHYIHSTHPYYGHPIAPTYPCKKFCRPTWITLRTTCLPAPFALVHTTVNLPDCHDYLQFPFPIPTHLLPSLVVHACLPALSPAPHLSPPCLSHTPLLLMASHASLHHCTLSSPLSLDLGLHTFHTSALVLGLHREGGCAAAGARGGVPGSGSQYSG